MVDPVDIASFRESGYLLCRDFFSREEVKDIYLEAKLVFETQMLRLGFMDRADSDDVAFTQGMFEFFNADIEAFSNCGKQAQHLISLHRLSLDERIVDTLKQLGVTWPNISTRPLLYFNHPNLAKKEVYWRLSLHQDWRSMQGSLDSIVVWLPLIDIDRSLGALEVVPKSHSLGLADAEFSDGYGHVDNGTSSSDLETIAVNRGDALFFSTFLLHQSGTNVTDNIRWSCHFRYNNLAEQTFVERGYPHPYIYKPSPDLITANFPMPEQVSAAIGTVS